MSHLKILIGAVLALVLGASTATADLLGGSGGGTLGGVITTVTGTVGGVTGTVGGVVGTVGGVVGTGTGTLENVLDSPPSSGDSSLPDDSVDTLVESLLGAPPTSSTGTQGGSDPDSGAGATASSGPSAGAP